MSFPQPASAPNLTGQWKLVWADEFDQPGLPDPGKWNYESGLVRNNELQFYTTARSANARVENGCLVIEAHKEPWEGAEYTSASLHTLGKTSWLYGRLEARAKVPAGRGTWPAFWTLGDNIEAVDWPACGEIDILEHVGHDPGMIYGNLHYGATEHQNEKGNLTIPDASSAFHVYAVEWYADRIGFFVDDQRYLTCHKADSKDGSWPYNHPHYLIVNLAVGGNWGGEQGVDETAFPQRYEIDYVRVYQQQP